MRDRNVTPELALDARQLYLLRLIGEEGACNAYPPELFYPEQVGGDRLRQIKEAKRVCDGCPVEAECLEYALSVPEGEGVWGGLSEFERRRLRRRSA